MSVVKHAKYTTGVGFGEAVILKDGHAMFIQDVARDLNRKSHLEEENVRLQAGIQAAVDSLWSWIYSAKHQKILAIYDNLKALLKGGGNG